VKHLSEEKLVEILSNPVFACLQGKRLYKEQKFLVALPACETFGQKPNADPSWKNARGEEVIFQGAIDLLAIGEDGDAQIIDYKFSKGGAEYLAEHYRLQLHLYRKAAAKILRLDETRIRCTIVNINHGFQVEID
jgi:ATP-dependent exoDNAse (exonuclease V) beta subunit